MVAYAVDRRFDELSSRSDTLQKKIARLEVEYGQLKHNMEGVLDDLNATKKAAVDTSEALQTIEVPSGPEFDLSDVFSPETGGAPGLSNSDDSDETLSGNRTPPGGEVDSDETPPGAEVDEIPA